MIARYDGSPMRRYLLSIIEVEDDVQGGSECPSRSHPVALRSLKAEPT